MYGELNFNPVLFIMEVKYLFLIFLSSSLALVLCDIGYGIYKKRSNKLKDLKGENTKC